MMRVLSLFAGIGGFDLGLQRTGGFRTVAFCEIDPFCRRVLARHWPEVPCYDDVRSLTAERLRADGIAVDVICGGFPCQDISSAGRGAGLAGERSGLWREYARLIGELRPRYVLVENVAALLGRGLGHVLGDLASLGFDAEWHCIPASAVGAPHRRDRVWIVAYAQRDRHQASRSQGGRDDGDLRDGAERAGHIQAPALSSRSQDVADANGERRDGRPSTAGQQARAGAGVECGGQIVRAVGGHWCSEPDVGRVAHGIPSRVDRLRGVGNAVVPQVVELLGRAILASEAAA